MDLPSERPDAAEPGHNTERARGTREKRKRGQQRVSTDKGQREANGQNGRMERKEGMVRKKDRQTEGGEQVREGWTMA